MIENVSTQLTVFYCLCPLPASRKGLRLPLRSALFGEGGRDWRPCKSGHPDYGRRHHEEEFELGPVIQEMSFKGISYKSSVGPLLSRAEPFVQF